jgi:hypothetical protein
MSQPSIDRSATEWRALPRMRTLMDEFCGNHVNVYWFQKMETADSDDQSQNIEPLHND